MKMQPPSCASSLEAYRCPRGSASAYLRSGNGLGLIVKVDQGWLRKNGIRTLYIEPEIRGRTGAFFDQ